MFLDILLAMTPTTTTNDARRQWRPSKRFFLHQYTSITMAGNKNSGRKKNQSYKRRTNNEIERDRREEQREAQERRVRPRIDPNFFAARQPQPTHAAAANAPQDSGGASPNSNPPPDPDPPAQDRIDPDHPNPTHENPLPGVDMTRVPELFRLPIGQVLHKLRSNMKKGRGKEINMVQEWQGVVCSRGRILFMNGRIRASLLDGQLHLWIIYCHTMDEFECSSQIG